MAGDTIQGIQRLGGEARRAGLSHARQSPTHALAREHRASLVGTGRTWRFTNLKKPVRVMATWR